MLRGLWTAKKLITPAGCGRSAEGGSGRRKMHPKKDALRPSVSWGSGRATLEQLWTSEGGRGMTIHSPQSVSIWTGKAVFLPPQQWSRVYLPFKVIAEGGVSVFIALQRVGLLTGLAITKGGQLRVNIFNSSAETVYLTPKTVMVNVQASEIRVKRHGDSVRLVGNAEAWSDFGQRLKEEITTLFPRVGDLSCHPVNAEMQKLMVRSSEVVWKDPPERGSRTQYAVDDVADRRLVAKQLQEYIQRGYLHLASISEDLYLSPLLPIRKPNGTFRFTNDFRKLNSYFPSGKGTTQVDVWRKMWEINPKWRFYMKIDLKDGFFGIPVDETLSRLFGFSYGSDRFRWCRLPQGWKWSSILFCERVAEILRGIFCPQYSDDVLVGAESPEELREKALNVFSRFDQYGVKVNYEKVTWFTDSVTFLGHEISGGKWSFEKYLTEKMANFGIIDSAKKLEAVLGVLSYVRRCVKHLERILGPLRDALSQWKSGPVTDAWQAELQQKVKNAFREALDNLHWLVLPGAETDDFVFELETDWSTGHSGYMLFARRDGEERLIDIGSKKHGKVTSSYLGELDAIKWACSKTKAFRGSLPLLIRTDSQSVCSKAQSGSLYDSDVRAYRRWAWLAANEPGYKLQFVPGSENKGADLLSRPQGGVYSVRVCLGVTEDLVCDPDSDSEVVRESVRIPAKFCLQNPCEISFEEDLLSNCVEDLVPFCQKACRSSAQRIGLERQIREVHAESHWGPFKTFHALRAQGIEATWTLVRKVCKECAICAQFRPLLVRRKLGQPPYSLIPGHTVYVDLVGPLPDVYRVPWQKAYCYIQSMVDSATRMYSAHPLRSTDSGGALSGLDQWILSHGPISVLVTDNGSTYNSKEVDAWCAKNKVVHEYIAPYSHQSLGMVEKMNRTVVDRLRKFTLAHGGEWLDHLQSSIDCINSAIHHTTLRSPRELWRGTELMRREAFELTQKEREERNKTLRVFSKPYAVGDLVWGYHQGRERIKRNKLMPRWLGPLRIIEQKEGHLWRTEMMSRPGKPGRKPIMVFHENFMMPYP